MPYAVLGHLLAWDLTPQVCRRVHQDFRAFWDESVLGLNLRTSALE